jgi:antitoxin ParD1/3/4
MTVKTAVSFTDKHHEFARKKVDEGAFASVSSVVAAGIEQVMRDEAEREAALEAMKDTIRQRMATPRSEFVPLEGDDAFDRARAHIEARRGQQ